MSIKEKIDGDLKAAMLAGDKTLVTTLRGLKSVILYAEVAKGARESGGLGDAEVIDILAKEAKKRQESADLYARGGNSERREAELAEKAVIERYLPERLGEAELEAVVEEVIAQTGAAGQQAMGQVIGAVKQRTQGAADGVLIAKLVKERLQ